MTAWIERGAELLRELTAVLERFGVSVSSALHVEADGHPCPGYIHDACAIRFCPPVVAAPVDRLRWAFFQSYMGCESLAEAEAFYEVALPLVIAHELAHHVRITTGLASDSAFVEEQVCDRIAVALVEATGRGATLEPLRQKSARMRARLDQRFAATAGSSFVPDVAEALVLSEHLGRDELASLEALARRGGLSVDRILPLYRRIDRRVLDGATLDRERARLHVEAHYTRDPAEYWHLSLRWVESYLSGRARPTLIEILSSHLVAERPRSFEVVSALERSLADGADPGEREAAALGLLTLLGSGVAHDLVDIAEAASGSEVGEAVLAAFTKAWPRTGGWDPRAALRLANALASSAIERGDTQVLAAILRLAGVATRAAQRAHDPAIRRLVAAATKLVDDPSVALEICAARLENEAPSPDALIARSAQLLGARAVVVALAAWGRPSGSDASAIAIDLCRDQAALRDPAVVAAIARLTADHPEIVSEALIESVKSLVRGDERARGPSLDELTELVAFLARARPEDRDFFARRGSSGHRRLLGSFDPTGGSEPARPLHLLRLMAARADHAGREGRSDPQVLGAAVRLLESALALRHRLALAVHRMDARIVPLAEEAVVLRLRDAVLEVVAALAPMEDGAMLARLISAQPAREAIAPAIRALLLDVLTPRAETAAAPLLKARRLAARALESSATAQSGGLVVFDGDDLDVPQLIRRFAAEKPYDVPMRTLVERLVHLRAVPLFAHVGPDALLELSELTADERVSAGETIFEEGARGNRMHVLLVGRVELRRVGETAPIATLDPPACFGEMAIFDGEPRSATAIAVTDCRLLTLDGEALRQAGRSSPELYEALLRVLAARLRKR